MRLFLRISAVIVTVLVIIFVVTGCPNGDNQLDPEMEEAANKAFELIKTSPLSIGGTIELSGVMNGTTFSLPGIIENDIQAPEPDNSAEPPDPEETAENEGDQGKADQIVYGFSRTFIGGLSRTFIGSGGNVEGVSANSNFSSLDLNGTIKPATGPNGEERKNFSLTGTIGDVNAPVPEPDGDPMDKQLEMLADKIVTGLSEIFFDEGGEVTLSQVSVSEGTVSVPSWLTVNGTLEGESDVGTVDPAINATANSVTDLVIEGWSRTFIGEGGMTLKCTVEPPGEDGVQVIGVRGDLRTADEYYLPDDPDLDINKLSKMIFLKLREMSRAPGGNLTLNGTFEVDSDGTIRIIEWDGVLDMFPLIQGNN